MCLEGSYLNLFYAMWLVCFPGIAALHLITWEREGERGMGERRRESGKEGDRKNSREKIKNHIDTIIL